jgi:hypothetical protein
MAAGNGYTFSKSFDHETRILRIFPDKEAVKMLSFRNIHELDSSILTFLTKHPEFLERAKSLTTTLSDDSNFHQRILKHQVDATGFRVPCKKFEVLVGLGLISWYMSPEIGILLRFSLAEVDWGVRAKESKTFVLESKEHCLAYLILQDLWSDRDFFGNVLGNKLLAYQLKTLNWKLGSAHRKVIRPQRKRGHRESHSEPFGLPREYLDDLRTDVWYQEKVQTELEAEQLRFLQMKERVERFLAS